MEHAVIRLKAGEKTPFYEQIYAYFAAAIRSGALAAGEKLPSKRRLAQDVGVSISTVETAYAMLVAEGYLEAKPRSGFRVCSLSALQRPVTPHHPRPSRCKHRRASIFPPGVWTPLCSPLPPGAGCKGRCWRGMRPCCAQAVRRAMKLCVRPLPPIWQNSAACAPSPGKL